MPAVVAQMQALDQVRRLHRPRDDALRPCVLTSLHRTIGATMRVVLQPAVEMERWSLYWCCSLATRCELLDPLHVEVDDATHWKAGDLIQHAMQACSWPPPSETAHSKVPGFSEPIYRAICEGTELDSDATLAESGIEENAQVISIEH